MHPRSRTNTPAKIQRLAPWLNLAAVIVATAFLSCKKEPEGTPACDQFRGEWELIKADEQYLLYVTLWTKPGPGYRVFKSCEPVSPSFYTDRPNVVADLNKACAEFASQLSGGAREGRGNEGVSDPADAEFADLNLDGILDIAIADRGSDAVAVYLANSDGTYPDACFLLPVGPVPDHVMAADFNRDTFPDLVTANASDFPGPGSLSIVLGNGDGTFLAASTFDAPGTLTVTDVAVGDFDRNGNPDLAYTALDGLGLPFLSVRLGNGDGSFQAEVQFSLPDGGNTVRVVDLNDAIDDHDDILTNGAFFLGNGDGTFQAATQFSQTFSASIAEAGDLDGDGHADIAAANPDHLLSVLRGNGDGTFQAPFHRLCGGAPEWIHFDDLNGDGLGDLFVSHFPGIDPFDIYFGDGSGSLGGTHANASVTDLQSRLGADGVALGEFTGDGIADLVVASGDVGPPGLLPGLGRGSFGAPKTIPGGSGWAVVAGDWNGDGIDDVAFAGVSLAAALGNGDGTFGAFSFSSLAGAPRDSRRNRVFTDLLDQGATPDLVVVNAGTGEITPFLGNGDGTFAAGVAVMASTAPKDIAVADFNEDGRRDVVAVFEGNSGKVDGELIVALGNGDGTFQAFQILRDDVAPSAVTVADFDGDDHLDLAVALEVSVFNWDVEIYLGTGSGDFGLPETLGLAEAPRGGIEALDFDRDGNPDLMVAVGGSSVIGLRGLGNGTFVEVVHAPLGNGELVAADIDKDGWPDLVSASHSGYVAVRRNPLTADSASPFLEIVQNGADLIVRWPRAFPELSLFETKTMQAAWEPSVRPVATVGRWFEAKVQVSELRRFFILRK